MKTVCITGGIGSGKSVVCSVFAALGIPVYNADAAARQLYEDDTTLKEAVVSLFGDGILDKCGKVDRKKLAEIVFSDKAKLEALNKIVHPRVKDHFVEWKKHQSEAPYVIREAAILFESGTDKDCESIITVLAPEELRIQRIKDRDKRSKSEVEQIIANQFSDEERIPRSDFLIYNDEQKAVIPQVLEIHEKLLGGND